MHRRPALVSLWVLVVSLAATVAWADPVLTRDEAGEPQPGLVVGWREDPSGDVILGVKPGWGEPVRHALFEALSEDGATVLLLDGGTLMVGGVALDVVLSKMVGLDVAPPETAAPSEESDSEESDSMAGMLAADASTLLVAPDGSSSLRVSGELEDADSLARQFIARVVAVDRERGFPYARVRVRVETQPLATLKGRPMPPGSSLLLVPFMAQRVVSASSDDPASLDLNDPATRANLGAWFLKPGDRVKVIPGAAGKEDALNVHRIDRVREGL